MELDDTETLRLVKERISAKVYSFNSWSEFIVWAKAMTQAKFKTFVIKCIDDSVADGDTRKTDLLEVKALLEQ